MNSFTRIFYWGMLISFLGSLPPGIINLVAIQIAEKQGNKAAFIYATGSMLGEIVVVKMALSSMNWLMRRRKFFYALEWITVILFFAFAIGCFIAAGSMQGITFALPEIMLPAFVSGVLISILNPMHIPFWLSWSSVLINKGIMRPAGGQHAYLAGIAIGTMSGFTTFIYGGQYLLQVFQSQSLLINCVAGLILLVLTFRQVRNIVKVPASARYARFQKTL